MISTCSESSLCIKKNIKSIFQENCILPTLEKCLSVAFSLSCLVPLLCLSPSWEETLTRHPNSQLHSHRLFSPHPYGSNRTFFINAGNLSHIHSRDTWTRAIQVTPLQCGKHMFFTAAGGNLRVTWLSLYGSHAKAGPTSDYLILNLRDPAGSNFCF